MASEVQDPEKQKQKQKNKTKQKLLGPVLSVGHVFVIPALGGMHVENPQHMVFALLVKFSDEVS